INGSMHSLWSHALRIYLRQKNLWLVQTARGGAARRRFAVSACDGDAMESPRGDADADHAGAVWHQCCGVHWNAALRGFADESNGCEPAGVGRKLRALHPDGRLVEASHLLLCAH